MSQLVSDHVARAGARIRPPAIVLTLAVTCVSTISVWVTADTRAAAAVLLAGVAVSVAVHVGGLAGGLAAFALVLVPPGVVGENSAFVAVAALLLVLAVAATFHDDPERAARLPEAVVVLMCVTSLLFPSMAMLRASPPNAALALGAMWALSAAIVIVARRSVGFLTAALRALTVLATFGVCSYAVSYVLDFTPSTTFQGSSRDVVVHFPFTMTRGDAGSLFHEPRFSVFSGEPGLGALILLIAIWGALRLYRGSSRVLLVGLLLGGGVLTQSTGFMFSILSFGIVVGVATMARQRGWLPASALAVVALPLAYVASTALISSKVVTEKQSITDRGFLGGTAAGEINLFSLLQDRPYLALPLLALLGLLAWQTRALPVEAALVAAIGLAGLAAQPIHLHPGIWLLLVVSVLFVGPDVDGRYRRQDE